ncbi:heavy metal efflux pump, CzcA family protein (plasmid) [Leptolyngbya boryana NIES-2135]|jgi:nickel/cobalt tolerance cation efflux system protein|uniref:Heavy metal efflux pump, CzcA family protein n=1 Tax=Leptolyngbya boryana NIES-2135 TaxID=1973484 RepID=A0A1Z4JRM4_LEPBY|nr:MULTISPECIES: efflux RND transporter permease subunit [Leptolyngbya]BAY59356.1 heavy metal efflux pump, CzcA family protein [Leptolyngbya boryana NIES-2135]MBD2372944.1 CusA/CzcA family heavy metal efflux RND transporter [Leptolyngbya sp. FACHB-238]MBD2397303.1 CusA/CzcA family heavy metal efflux RND transporter [Leptolyngbya sp. FACHB-239]MBD2403892.1 CusA/CzcA family heavy metal efflux RND transporter [Leptolyngbya sp. FACHB-402]ULP33188.1 efflux RND transporter permease subunit [Leptolyn
MLNAIVKWAIAQRWLVVIGAIVVVFWIGRTVTQMPLDVLPSFAPPQIEIQTEAPGLAPEEVESLISLPLESSINGTPGVTTVRSSSAAGISVVRVVFSWGTDIYKARQLVTERLQLAQSKLPEGAAAPQISPPTSPIGTVVKYAFTTDGQTSMMELRRAIDWQVTNRLMSVPGVSQVLAFGGDERQFQVLVDPQKLKAFNVSLNQISEAVRSSNSNASGGYLITSDQETLVRGIGRVENLDDLKQSVITSRQGTPVRLMDVAEVQIGSGIKRGDGSLNGQPAIILMVNKQPMADTPSVARGVEAAIKDLEPGLPKGTKVTRTFRQEEYIQTSVDNVRSALVEGGIIVAIILIPFLMNWRILAVCISALTLSLLLGLLALSLLGQSLNTMTLGGLAVAIGSAVDDAIVYAENAFRCLRENRQSPNPRSALEVVYQGCADLTDSVFGATLITVVVFAPIFALTGVEGSIFSPMGIGYLVTVLASSLTAVTITPALCALLLPSGRLPDNETWTARFFKRLYEPLLIFSMRKSTLIIATALGVTVASFAIIPGLGRIFLPEFQEQTLVNTLMLYPGSSLDATNKAGFVVEESLKDDPRYSYVQLRSGRALGDGDAAGVNLAHLDIGLSEEGMKNRAASMEKMREEFSKIPGAAPNIGGFISHRMDEVLSGVRSAIAVKIFGADLDQLRTIGQQIEAQMKSIDGILDLQLEPQVPIPQVQIKFDRAAASRYGLSVGALSETIETALNGRVVSQVLENQQTFDLVVWLKPEARNSLETIENLLVDTANGQKIPLAQVARVVKGTGPNTINRENVSRLIVVSANVKGRDLRSVVNDIQAKVQQNVQLPAGYFVQYGGQFEAEERASQNILLFSAIAFVVITVLMYFSVKSIPSTLMIMVNLPIGLVGGVIAVALSGGILSIASLVGFVTLFGVATRNGLLLVDNYNAKFAEGMPLKEVIIKGSQERLNAILMTAFTSALGLFPLIAEGGPGKEILQPLSIVVLGGLFTSTALTLLMLPALYAKFGKVLFPKSSASIDQADTPGMLKEINSNA